MCVGDREFLVEHGNRASHRLWPDSRSRLQFGFNSLDNTASYPYRKPPKPLNSFAESGNVTELVRRWRTSMQRRLRPRLLAGLLIIFLTTPGLEAGLVQNRLRIFIIE